MRVLKLRRADSEQILLEEVQVAETFWTRLRGLIGTTELSEQQGMWFDNANSIHTFWMSINIDCIFLDRSLQVVAIVPDFPKRRLTRIYWKANSVLEIKGGRARSLNLQVGEKLVLQ